MSMNEMNLTVVCTTQEVEAHPFKSNLHTSIF